MFTGGKKMRNLLITGLFLLIVCFAWAQGLETFDNLPLSGTSYVDGSFEGENGITWNYFAVTGQQSYPIDGNGLLLRQSEAPSRIVSELIPGGIGNFSVQLRKAFTSAGDRQVELLINGESKGVSLIFGSETGEDETIHTFAVQDINITGYFTLEIRHLTGGTTSRQLVLDNIEWTGYLDGPYINVNTFALAGFEYVAGDGPSDFQHFTMSASNLEPEEGVLEIGGSDYFELSIDDVVYANNLQIPYTDGTFEQTTVFVRMVEGLEPAVYEDTISITGGGADELEINLSGRVLRADLDYYSEDFSGFVSMETLPAHWTLDEEYEYMGDFGVGTSGGIRGNGVLGFQLVTAAPNNSFTATLTIPVDESKTITALDISYLGKVARATVSGTPKWTVAVNGVEVPELEFSTESGEDQLLNHTIDGIVVTNEIVIVWHTDIIDVPGVRRQIGIDNVEVAMTFSSAEDNFVTAPVARLKNAYPNPFNPSTNLSFSIANSEKVLLEVYNVKGQRVAVLVDDVLQAGNHSVIWNANNSQGNNVTSGVYFYRLTTPTHTETKRVLFLK